MRCSTGKVIHTSRGRAVAAVKAEPLKCFQIYRCKVCGNWHLAQDHRGKANFQSFIDRVLQADRERAVKA